MANTFTQLYYHLIWSTKRREPLIHQDVEKRIWALIANVAWDNGSPSPDIETLRVGGIENHVHAVVSIPKTMAVATAVKSLKGASSAIINKEGLVPGHFGWQDGYGAFTVSASQLDAVKGYVDRQREHHQKVSFEDEYRAFMEKHGVEYDERYLFD